MSHRMTTIAGAAAIALLLAIAAGLAAALFARPAAAQTAPTATAPVRQVTVVGHGEAKARPDTATVQIGVETEAANAKDALAQNNKDAAAIQAKLKSLGVADKDMQTSGFNIFPVYDQNGKQVTGYRVNNTLSVKIRDLDQAGGLLDAVVKAGANSIYGIQFSVEDPRALQDQARQAAMQDALARAQTLAKAGGAAVSEVLVITENIHAPPIPMPMVAEAKAQSAGDSVAVQPGEQTISADVQVTYTLK
jgi:uncharacterized protein YggE